MIPTLPPTSVPNETSAPPNRALTHSLLAIYVVAGAIGGTIAGVLVLAAWIPSEIIRSAIHARFDPPVRTTRQPSPPPVRSGPHELIPMGTFTGAAAGVALLVTAIFWPTTKHCVRAALLCASIAASIRMIGCVLYLDDRPEASGYAAMLMAILIAGGAGAILGVSTTVMVSVSVRIQAHLESIWQSD